MWENVPSGMCAQEDSNQPTHPLSLIITKTGLFKYTENFTHKKKNENFQIKKSLIFFLISAQNMDCGYSLEPPRRGGSNEYPQSMFLRRN